MKLSFILALTLLTVQSQAPKGVIEGRVVRATSREPISGVLITLTAPVSASASTGLPADAAARLTDQIATLTESGNRAGATQDVIDNAIENLRRNAVGASSRPITATTDDSGRFSFRDLVPGRYTVRAELDGYFAAPLNGSAAAAATKVFNVEDEKTKPPEDIPMVKGAVVSGRVRDPNGQPISGMNVSVYRVTYNNGRKLWSVANSKTTDDRGEYRIFWIPPGDYFVGVVPRAPNAIPNPQDSWARTFFPGTIEPGFATPIEIRDGNEASGTDIDIQALPTVAFKISGVAVNNAARPNPTTGVIDRSIASFVLAPRNPGVLDAINPPSVVNALPVASRANGEFELRNIRPGAYDLYPVAPVITDNAAGPILQPVGTPLVVPAGTAAVSRRQPTARVPLDINRDITDIRIVINDGVPLTGQVHVNGMSASAIKLESIRLNLRPLDSTPATFVNLNGTVTVDATGKFTTQNLPEARYAFQINGLPAAAFVADIRQGGSSVMDTGFVLDSSASPVEIVVDPNGVTVQGTVLNVDGKPAANATVALVPPPSRRQNMLLYKNITTTELGAFTLRGVAPGTYTIYAWESVPPGAWQNAEFLAKHEGRGRPISVNSGAVSEVQLNIIP
jgi:hypothetical protein